MYSRQPLLGQEFSWTLWRGSLQLVAGTVSPQYHLRHCNPRLTNAIGQELAQDSCPSEVWSLPGLLTWWLVSYLHTFDTRLR